MGYTSSREVLDNLIEMFERDMKPAVEHKTDSIRINELFEIIQLYAEEHERDIERLNISIKEHEREIERLNISINELNTRISYAGI